MAREPIENKPIGRALMILPERGRELIQRIPEPVQLKLKHISKRGFIITLEVFAGLLVVGTIALGLAYTRINQGPISLSFLVDPIENSINRELAGLSIKIEDAVLKRDENSLGVAFRLKNIKLVNAQGSIVAQAPLAAIGLSGRALLWGRIAPGSVDFIGPRLLLYYKKNSGLALSFSRPDPDSEYSKTAPQSIAEIIQSNETGETIAQRSSGPEITNNALRQINLVEMLSEAFEEARHKPTASLYLTNFGVRDAKVIFEYEGKQSLWNVPDLTFDMKHYQKRSILHGKANIQSKAGQWQLKFNTEQSEKRKEVVFSGSIDNFIPRSIASQFPVLKSIKYLDLPISGKTKVRLTEQGDLKSIDAKIRLMAGRFIAPWDEEDSALIDNGDLHVRYNKAEEKIEIIPSKFSWGKSQATVSGEFKKTQNEDGSLYWNYLIEAKDAVLATEEFGVAPHNVDQWFAKGKLDLDHGVILIDQYLLQLGTSSLEIAGKVIDAPGSPELQLVGRISPMPISMFKRIWPRILMPKSRGWVGENAVAGEVTGGTINMMVPGGVLGRARDGGDIPDESVSVSIAIQNLQLRYMSSLPNLYTQNASINLMGRKLSFSIPEGQIAVPSGETITVVDTRFLVEDLRPKPAHGEILFKTESSAPALLELLDNEPFNLSRNFNIKPQQIGGKAKTEFRLNMPLKEGVDLGQMKISGTAVHEDVKTPSLNIFEVNGGKINFGITEKAIDASGQILINGVPAEVSWQHIYGGATNKQPSVRISGTFDDSARKQIGLPVNHLIKGDISAVVTMINGPGGNFKALLEADLTRSELVMEHMGWSKPPGRAATLTFSIAKQDDDRLELQNFKVIGDDIAINGWVTFGEDSLPSAFYFPEFSVDIITNMEIAGQKQTHGIWKINAKSHSYDGRQFFKSLFSAGQLTKGEIDTAGMERGIDLTAEIQSMIGFGDTQIQNFTVDLKRRNGFLSALEARGKINGKKPLAVKLEKIGDGPRTLLAETSDAGGAFRLVGFYPKIEGGDASLKVNLDGQGYASKTGTLWARNFVILGDAVVDEVLSTALQDQNSVSTSKNKRKKVQHQRIAFDRMYIPFSVGHGQFVLHDSQINGPLLGATMRGQIDFNRQRMDVGGTYVPLFGLNSALGDLPIIGELLVGRQGEGILGITFAIQGNMESPQVIVNPMSMVAPGIFRQIFEMTNPDPRVIPRSGNATPNRQKKKTRPKS